MTFQWKKSAIAALLCTLSGFSMAQMNAVYTTASNQGITHLTVNGTELLTGCGFYFIGSQTGADNSNNITTCQPNNGMMTPTGGATTPYLPHQLLFSIDPNDSTKMYFGGQIGYNPSTTGGSVRFATVSMPLDGQPNIYKYFRSSGSGAIGRSFADIGVSGSGAGGSDDSYSIAEGTVYIAKNGTGQTWGEIISDDYTVRVTLTGTTRQMPLYFIRHPNTRTVEYSFNALELGDTANVTGYVQVLPTDPESVPHQTFESESSSYHQIGQADGDGWSVYSNATSGLYMNYGPYTTSVGSGTHIASFRLQVDNTTADNNALVVLEIYNASTSSIIASRTLTRGEFSSAFTYKYFHVPFSAPGGGALLEFRTKFLGGSYLKQDKVVIR